MDLLSTSSGAYFSSYMSARLGGMLLVAFTFRRYMKYATPDRMPINATDPTTPPTTTPIGKLLGPNLLPDLSISARTGLKTEGRNVGLKDGERLRIVAIPASAFGYPLTFSRELIPPEFNSAVSTVTLPFGAVIE